MSVPNYTEDRPTAVFDCECFPNFWSIAFRDVNSDRVRRFVRTKDIELDVRSIANIIRKWRIVGFNSRSYDMQIIALAITGATNSELKAANDVLIPGRGMRGPQPWQFLEKYNLTLPNYLDHVDLFEVSPGSPGKPSLKIYAGRLHSKRMQELPFKIDHHLSAEDMVVVNDYHDNDLDVTKDLYLELKPQIELRAKMSEQYGVDLRSKSDAQVAEAVMKAEIERLTGKRVWKPEIKPGHFTYRPPAYIKFKTPAMQEMLAKITGAKFIIDRAGKVNEPDFLKKMPLPLGDSVYTMGIGGLHSKEKASWHRSDGEFFILDRDVTSYYPSIILLLKLYPKHIGPPFLKILRKLFDRRLDAKARAKALEEANQYLDARPFSDIAETLKIVLNGLFGKFGSAFAVVYAPDLMVATTLTGQLSVLMLIEELVVRGFRVVSANTDGFVTLVPKHRRDEFNCVMYEWEWDTGLATEETEYQWLYSANVNNYIALDSKNKVKRKGRMATPAGPGQKGASGMKKNPAAEICIEAVIAFVKDGTPIADTVHYCEDIRKFITVGRVNGGATKDGEDVGSAIRWYYSQDENSAILRAENSYTVGRTMGAKVCLELPDELPDDIDHNWYIREAHAILQDYGVDVRDPATAGRKGMFTGRLDGKKTYHTVDVTTSAALCGKRPASMREPWLEDVKIDTGYRFCTKCMKASDV